MFCANCGSALVAQAKFCSACGHVVAGEAAAPSVPSTPAVSRVTSTVPPLSQSQAQRPAMASQPLFNETGPGIGDMVLASPGARLGAAVVDYLLVAPIAILAVLTQMAADTNGFGVGLGVGSALYLVLIVIQLVFLAKLGQSIGKRVLGIRIVSFRDGRRVGFARLFLLRVLAPALLGAVPYVGWLFAIIDCLMIFRADRRSIHDMMAESCVVVATPEN